MPRSYEEIMADGARSLEELRLLLQGLKDESKAEARSCLEADDPTGYNYHAARAMTWGTAAALVGELEQRLQREEMPMRT